MPILGIGVDLVHIPRISAILLRNKAERFATRILSEREFSEWQNLSDEDSVRAKFLAVRWSVKEAAYKAIYPVARPTWKEFTYCGLHAACKPTLMYHPLSGKDNTRTINKIHVSVSHDGEYVYTSVIVEGTVDCVAVQKLNIDCVQLYQSESVLPSLRWKDYY